MHIPDGILNTPVMITTNSFSIIIIAIVYFISKISTLKSNRSRIDNAT
jgi:ABC-type Co2+ transport system permease subunit